jgi:hypothetical protein
MRIGSQHVLRSHVGRLQQLSRRFGGLHVS